MATTNRAMFSALLQTQQFFTTLGISRFIRKIPLAYAAYKFLYRNCVPREQLSVLAMGHTLHLDPKDMGVARSLLLYGGRWEETETRLFSSIVKEGMTVVDVGANVGYYTLLAARLVGKSGTVFAFEPSPENFALLQRNVEANGYRNVICVPKAVSNRCGTAKLTLYEASSGGHSLSEFRGGSRFVEVETVSLDEYFANRREAISVLKMDTEGAEMTILDGMRNVLSSNPHLALMTEFFPYAIKSFGHSPEEYVRRLASHGFRIYPILENHGTTEPLDFERLKHLLQSLAEGGKEGRVVNLLCLRGTTKDALQGDLR